MMSRNIRTSIITIMLALIVLSVQQVDALSDNFEKDSGNWEVEVNPKGVLEKGNFGGWSIDKGIVAYDPAKGANSRMMTGKESWSDYIAECDIKFLKADDYPGGIRTYVDIKTGGHYAVWFYPKTKEIKLFSGTAWDINAGLKLLGAYKEKLYDAKVDVFYHVKVVHKGDQIEVWFGKSKDNTEKIIEAKDGTFKSGLFAFDGYNQPLHFDNFEINGPGISASTAVESQDKLAIVWGTLKVK